MTDDDPLIILEGNLPDPRPGRDENSSTLLALLAVGILILLALAYSQCGPKIHPMAEKRAQNSKILLELSHELSAFQKLCHRYPTTQEGLKALTLSLSATGCGTPNPARLLNELPRDAWDEELQYHSDGKTYQLDARGEGKFWPRSQGWQWHWEPGFTEPKWVHQ